MIGGCILRGRNQTIGYRAQVEPQLGRGDAGYDDNSKWGAGRPRQKHDSTMMSLHMVGDNRSIRLSETSGDVRNAKDK